MATARRGNRSGDRSSPPTTETDAIRATGESLDVFNAGAIAVPSAGTVANPDGIPSRDSVPGNRAGGESIPATMQDELKPGSIGDDQFGLNLQQGGGSTGFYGDRSLELPETPRAGDLAGLRQNDIDVGIDFANLAGPSSIDGRTHDAYDGVRGGSGPVSPADPGAMTGDGKSSGGSPFTTAAPGVFDFFKTRNAEKEVDAAIAGIEAGTKHNPYVLIQEENVGSVVDVPATEAATTTESTAEAALPPVQQTKQQWKFVGEDVPAGGHTDGGLPATTGKTTILEAWTGLFKDDLPPDHPDYAGGGGAAPPGSKTDDSITQSLLINLGGQRGGDVDPRGDGDVETSGEQLFDPKDSVIDPGPDSFTSTFEADRSMLGGPMDHVQPELMDE